MVRFRVLTRMTAIKTRLSLIALLAPSLCLANGPLAVKAINKLQLARPSETIELSAKDLAPLREADLGKIRVTDAQGKELLCQAVDTDYDELHRADTLIFQADFAPGESKTFTVTTGDKRKYVKTDFKAYGRFVRERFDDFAWENDRIASRTYGKALETWKGEPLTSSAIDVWSKRTPRMVIDEWYMADNYHVDAGEGADFYSAGASRGGGGNGLWAADRLWVSGNFAHSRVLANGPIRVLFELVYDEFDVNGTKVSEVKRIALDAGSHFNHFRSVYTTASDAPLITGIGLKKVQREVTDFNAAQGWFAKWEPVEKNAGQQGLAIIVSPELQPKIAADERNLLLLAPAPGNVADYWAGFGWDRAGQFTNFAAWKAHVDEFARRLRSPIEIVISPAPAK